MNEELAEAIARDDRRDELQFGDSVYSELTDSRRRGHTKAALQGGWSESEF